MSTNYYLNNYPSASLTDTGNTDTDKTIFGLEKNVIKRLNEYNDAYFKLGTCKYIIENLPQSVTFNPTTKQFTGATEAVNTTFSSRGCDNDAYTYSLQPSTNRYTVTNNLTTETDNLNRAVNDLNAALGAITAADRVSKTTYDTSMNHINNLVTKINNLRGEYDPKLQDIIENSNRSVSQQSIDSAAYIGVIMSIGLASLLFFTFVRSS